MKNKSKFNPASSNFGKYGWFLIIYCIFVFILACGINVAGLNLTVSFFADEKGWNYNQLLSFSSWAGYVSIVAAPFLGWFMDKIGLRKYFFWICLICAAGCLIWGYAAAPAMYFIGIAVVSAATNGASAMGTNNMMSIFFPRKKGVAMGWTTMGINISDIIYLPLLSLAIAHVGVQGSYLVIAVLFVILAVVAIAFLKNSPEEKGLAPDNEPITAEEIEALKEVAKKEKNALTIAQVLKQPQAWLNGIIFGLMNMCTTGILGQAVVYLVTNGISQEDAITLMSVSAVVGCLGSYLWGVLDAKIGPDKTARFLALWALIAIVLIALPFNRMRLYVAIAMFMFSAGGLANVNASLITSHFGRFGFAKAVSVINPITQVLRVSAFALLSLGLSMFADDYTLAFRLFLIPAAGAFVLALFLKNKLLVKSEVE